MIRYGKNRCKHDWVHRKDGYEEQCIGAICRKCGAFGCGCDVDWSMTTRKAFYARGVDSTANIGGKWVNPYVDRQKIVLKALSDLGGVATTRQIAKKTGLDAGSVSVSLILMRGRIKRLGGRADDKKWKMTA